MANNVKGKTTLSPHESAALMLGWHATWNPGNVHLSQCHLEWLLSQFVGVLWISKQCHMAAENNSNIPLEGRLPINPSHSFLKRSETLEFVKFTDLWIPLANSNVSAIYIHTYIHTYIHIYCSENNLPIFGVSCFLRFCFTIVYLLCFLLFLVLIRICLAYTGHE